MADAKATTSRLKITEAFWGTIYAGTKEELIARGVVRDAALFADGTEKDARGRTMRQKRSEQDGCEIRVTWLRESGRYEARVHCSEEESARRSKKDLMQFEQERAAHRSQRQTIEAAELGPRKLAKACFDGVALSLVMAFNMQNDPARPWRFPAETQERAKQLYHELQELFENGGMREERAQLAQADGGFQRFLSRAMGGRDAA